MEDEGSRAADELPLNDVGQKLRQARESKGLTIAEVAAETRIPQRHLQAIEKGEFDALPARTYAIGFTRSYAKLLGLDEGAIVAGVREHLGEYAPPESLINASFEPGDPERIPSARLALFGLFAAILLGFGGYAYYTSQGAPGATPALPGQPQMQGEGAVQMASSEGAAQMGGSSEDIARSGNGAASAPASTLDNGAPAVLAAARKGKVVFTATADRIWVRFTDADGRKLLEKTMTKGESYALPEDAQDPRINTGRPDALAITVGGKPVPPLANRPIAIGDGAVSAGALLSRARAQSSAISPVQTGGPA